MANIEVNVQEVETVATEETAKGAEKTKKASGVKNRNPVKEFFRKFMVSLKRRPHNIALFMLIVSFVVYSFSLTNISNTTAYVYGDGMGLCEFAIMLFSLLSIVCFLNAFPKRQKTKILMLILLFAMLALVIACDVIYFIRIQQALTRDNPLRIPSDGSRDYVLKTRILSIVHIVLLLISTVLIATIPLYGKLLNKIKTSIEVEYTEADEEVELADAD